MSMTETLGPVKAKFDPIKNWSDQAIESRKSATKHFADALVESCPVAQRIYLWMARENESHADVCEQRAAEYAGSN